MTPRAPKHPLNAISKQPWLTPNVARRAVYIDFEGNKNLASSFLGILVEDKFRQVILEEALWPASSLAQAKGHGAPKNYRPLTSPAAGARPTLHAGALPTIVEELLEGAEREGRVMVCWSTYEYEVMRRTRPDLTDRLTLVMRNGKIPAKTWLRRARPEVTLESQIGAGKHRLAAYLAVIGYKRSSHLGDRQAGQRIAFVRHALRKKQGDFNALTATAKAKWTKVLDHNWHDCYGLRELMMHVGTEPGT